MLCEHRRTSFSCFTFRIPMLHSVRLLASCEFNIARPRSSFLFFIFLVVTRITLSLFYFCEIIFASRFSAMRLSSHRSHTSSRFESLIAQINFYFILSRRSVRSRLCGSRSHGSPHELALRSLDDLFMPIPRFRFTRSALRLILLGLRLSVDFAPSAPHLTSKVSQFQDS